MVGWGAQILGNPAAKRLARLAKVVILTAGTLYTPSPGCKAIYVEAVAGGGAGGGAALTTNNTSVGAGGGGGAYSAKYLLVTKPSYSFVIGLGGTGVSGATGNNGSDTTFDNPSVCTAKAGTGGTTLAAGTSVTETTFTAGGAASSGVGDLKLDGGDGALGLRNAALNGWGGEGGGSNIGARAGSQALNLAGNTGKNYGGGGGGGASFNAAAQAGGNGANGVIRITEFF